MTRLIYLPKTRPATKEQNLAEEIILQSTDAFFLDDPALHSFHILDSVREITEGISLNSSSFSITEIEDIVGNIKKEITTFNSFKRKIYWKMFYRFYDNSKLGLASAKTSVVAGMLKSISEYLESVDGRTREYSNNDILNFINESTRLIEAITIEQFKSYMKSYEHSSIIYLTKMTSLFEELALDIIQDELDEDLLFKILYE